MFESMFAGWFENQDANYNDFVKALLKGNLKEMNIYMNDVALATFSSFDTGGRPSAKSQPERFYHGFVLGLLSDLREQYQIRSNRESGYGRYDIMLVPEEKNDNAIVMEFKVHEPDEETSLQDTVQSALKQIQEKNYDRNGCVSPTRNRGWRILPEIFWMKIKVITLTENDKEMDYRARKAVEMAIEKARIC